MEQELAGILLAKIQNTLNYDRTQVEDGSDVIIPIGDVYHTFIGNDILDMNHFAEEDAGATEQEVSGIFTARKEAVKTELTQIFQDPKCSCI